MEKHFIVATAGHVDHGKSALVKALTGTDPDRLPEEKTRGITLDLGFAHLELPVLPSTINSSSRRSDAKADQPPVAPEPFGVGGSTLSIGIVDVPGHEDFVKNMIAGVGSIDLALFVVAADDGWMPQTEEHLQILTYLGVARAVVALTKTDLVDPTGTAADVRKQLMGTPFEKAPIAETSVVMGDGLEELKNLLARQLSSLSPPRDLGKPRLFVDRVFSLRGIGTVTTGTLVGGKLLRGQDVIVQPRNLPTRIRTIQSHNREQTEIEPGTRTALNLPDTATGGVARGDVITASTLGEPTSTIDVLLTRSTRLGSAARPIKNNASVYLHHGTARVPARITIAGKNFAPAEVDLAQLRLESPIFAFVGDRFVLRDPSERQTLAGGVILDVQTSRKKFRESGQRHFLAARAKSPNDPVVAVRTEIQRDRTREQINILVQSNFSAGEIADAVERLIVSNQLVQHGDIVADETWWMKSRRRLIEAIAKEHAKHPQLGGLDLAQLRSEVLDISPKVFDALIVDLGRDGYAKTGNLIKQSGHRAVLPQNLAPAANKIRRLILAKPFDPPARKQMAPDSPGREALKFLIEQREIVEVDTDLVLSGKAFAAMKAAVADFISKNGPATVSELRQKLQTSRRTIVPLLEKLDREGVTRRLGDRRSLVQEIVGRANPALD
jgi:selenocysteine-specific elongation factor